MEENFSSDAFPVSYPYISVFLSIPHIYTYPYHTYLANHFTDPFFFSGGNVALYGRPQATRPSLITQADPSVSYHILVWNTGQILTDPLSLT